MAIIIAKINLVHLAGKALKHKEIRVLAEAKHDSFRDLVSKALVDGVVDDGEFHLVLDEMERFRLICVGSRCVDQQTKDTLIAHGCGEARADIVKRKSP